MEEDNRLSGLLGRFEQLDRELNIFYWENHSEINEIFMNYGLIRRYEDICSQYFCYQRW